MPIEVSEICLAQTLVTSPKCNEKCNNHTLIVSWPVVAELTFK